MLQPLRFLLLPMLALGLTACGNSSVGIDDKSAAGSTSGVSASSGVSSGASSGRTGTGGATVADLPRDCFWTVRSDPNAANVLFPDRAATYWAASLTIPAGGHVRLDSQYPRARYMSFNLYNTVGANRRAGRRRNRAR